ncbi:Excinuclease ABC C subunit domain protein [Desulfovibrio sp. X2]|uniref:GIY-YIG nuclease family protein n=1 Tax=Desulfovibrio sp. X2 TaxID=941449 RepID=UPI0003586D45|nr:GIY-YIG nuclease family protein [Desulfovibrio sp. X2]EPR39846.1 Excinuclease ABC C subunit domain protein [Desulfovibrio sp. X2]
MDSGFTQAKGWFVYLVRCADGTLYCGVTTDLSRRLAEHNGELPGGARYTRSRRPVSLAAAARVGDRAEACRLERRIKLLRKEDKRAVLAAYRRSPRSPDLEESP